MEETASKNMIRVRPLIPAHAFVFVASFCLMVIELVAGRVIAPFLGSSLYTWTGVIGVILAGMALGNYAGGRLSEMKADWKTVGLAFIFSGNAAIFSFYLSKLLGHGMASSAIPLPLAIILFATIAFLPVSLLLSAITPIVVTLTLRSLEKTGSTVGGIYAVSAIASIAGTFATGFFLIAWFGVKIIILCVGAVLILTGIVAANDRALATSRPVVIASVALLIGLGLSSFCDMETSYFCVNITKADTANGIVTRLSLDNLIHSQVTDDPKRIAYSYEYVYAIALEYFHRQTDHPMRTLAIGGGGYAGPRYILENYPDSDVTVAEIDPGVTAAAIAYMGLNPHSPIKTVNQDARLFLDRTGKDKTYDLVFGDAFNDLAIPYHLTTKEFFQIVHDHLAPGGLYLLNTIDKSTDGKLLAAFVNTAQTVFKHVEVAPVTAKWGELKARDTIVIIAGDEPIDAQKWLEAANITYGARIARPASVGFNDAKYLLSSDEKSQFLAARKKLVLTDDYVPTDNLAAPMFLDRMETQN